MGRIQESIKSESITVDYEDSTSITVTIRPCKTAAEVTCWCMPITIKASSTIKETLKIGWKKVI